VKILEKTRWKNHPWNLFNLVEEVDVDFLSSIKNPYATKETDDLVGKIHPQKVVFDEIIKNGMRDPLLIVISLKHKTIRLESGNHRVDEAKLNLYTHLPVATLIIDDKILKKGNGTHYFPAENLINFSKLIPNRLFLNDQN